MTAEPVRRRQRLSADQRREQLVAAAVQVLAGSGFRGTTADAIAAKAGVSKGLLWHYFTDLDDLLEHTGRQTLMALADAVGRQLDFTEPVPQLIRAAIHAAAGLRLSHSAERRALDEITSNLRSAVDGQRLTLREYESLYTAQESAIFRRGQETGELRDDVDARVLAVTYQGAVDAMLGYLDAYPDADAVRFADQVADVLLSGLTPVRKATGRRSRGTM